MTLENSRIRALNVRAPFAQFILSGEKRYECRSYPTAHRGPMVVVSSVTRPAKALLSQLGVTPQEAESYLYGYAIGVVDLVNVREGRRGDEALAFCDTRGAFVWIVANPRPIKPFRVAGRCGLYSLGAARITPVAAAHASGRRDPIASRGDR